VKPNLSWNKTVDYALKERLQDILGTWDFPNEYQHTCEHRDKEGHQDYTCWECGEHVRSPGPHDMPFSSWAVRLYMCHQLQHLTCMLTRAEDRPRTPIHQCPQCRQPHHQDTITQRIGWNEGKAT
jgi:hypothetical protein